MKTFEIVIIVAIVIVVILFFFNCKKMEGNNLPCTCEFIGGRINCPSSGVCPGSSRTRCNPNC